MVSKSHKEKKIKSVHLVLENCEVIVIPFKRINYMFFTLNRQSYEISGDYFKENYWTDDFYIEIENDPELMHSNSPNDHISVRDRLKMYHDITHIDLIFSDGSNMYVTVPWVGREEYTNYHQVNEFCDVDEYRGDDYGHSDALHMIVITINKKWTWLKFKRYAKILVKRKWKMLLTYLKWYL